MLTIWNLKNNEILELNWPLEFFQLKFLIGHLTQSHTWQHRSEVRSGQCASHDITFHQIPFLYFWTNSNGIWALSVKGLYVSINAWPVVSWGPCSHSTVSCLHGLPTSLFLLRCICIRSCSMWIIQVIVKSARNYLCQNIKVLKLKGVRWRGDSDGLNA